MFDHPSLMALESHKSEEYTELPEEGSPGSEVRFSEQMWNLTSEYENPT